MIEELERLYALRILSEEAFGARFLELPSSTRRTLERLLRIAPVDADSKDVPTATQPIREALTNIQGVESALAEEPLLINLARLQKQLGFADAEIRLLAFGVLLGKGRILRMLGKAFEDLSEQDLLELLAAAVQAPAHEIDTLLQPGSRLAASSLLSMNHVGWLVVGDWLDMSPGVRDALLAEPTAKQSAFTELFYESPSAQLSVEDYPHLKGEIDLATRYLKHALEHRAGGVNVLLHGVPGTGKTQLARALVQQLEASLFEVSVEKLDGSPIPARDRMEAYRLAQGILSNAPHALILFDEIEDVFPNGLASFLRHNEQRLEKGWMNKLLETNKVPALWITNSLEAIDDAFLRRFDMVIGVENPPAAVKKKLIERATVGLSVSERWVNALANHQDLSPAAVQAAVDVVKAASAGYQANGAEEQIERVLKGVFRARDRQFRLESEAVDFDPSYLNADIDVQAVIDGVRRFGEGRICLFGPPGTGKTAFGRFIARELGRPLLVRRASDLLGMYVGETERRIARAFARADEEGAVLLIDEADGFLRSRQAAERSYEVQMVNEMLTQLETFNGVLVASTNLPEMLDHATLRRFDYKIKLSPLNAQQTVKILRQTAHAFGWQIDDLQAKRAEKLANLTPGDFAVVTRRLRNEQSPSLDGLLDGLKREAQFKQQFDRRPIGFATA